MENSGLNWINERPHLSENGLTRKSSQKPDPNIKHHYTSIMEVRKVIHADSLCMPPFLF